MLRIGINGFGRIGRCTFRQLMLDESSEIVLINDLADIEILGHLLRYDSVHGRFPVKFQLHSDKLVFENGKTVKFSKHKSARDIPWKDNKVDIVIESTGIYLTEDKANEHLESGAKKVVLSAPPKDDRTKTVVLGVNEQEVDLSAKIISNASCTTNSIAPIIKVLKTKVDIQTGFINTIHSYTSDQKLHDAPHSDFRRARAATNSLIPTSTGAAKAITKIFPDMIGKIDGAAIRVPVIDGSLTELTLITNTPITKEEINNIVKNSSEKEMKGIVDYTEDPIVSVDIIGSRASCVFDAGQTKVINNMIKISAWYDNEMGYSTRIVDLVKKLA